MRVTRTSLLSLVAATLSAGSLLFAGQCMRADDADSAEQMVTATSVVQAGPCLADCADDSALG